MRILQRVPAGIVRTTLFALVPAVVAAGIAAATAAPVAFADGPGGSAATAADMSKALADLEQQLAALRGLVLSQTQPAPQGGAAVSAQSDAPAVAAVVTSPAPTGLGDERTAPRPAEQSPGAGTILAAASPGVVADAPAPEPTEASPAVTATEQPTDPVASDAAIAATPEAVVAVAEAVVAAAEAVAASPEPAAGPAPGELELLRSELQAALDRNKSLEEAGVRDKATREAMATTVSQLNARIDELEAKARESGDAVDQLETALLLIDTYEQTITKLESRVAELEARLALILGQ